MKPIYTVGDVLIHGMFYSVEAAHDYLTEHGLSEADHPIQQAHNKEEVIERVE